MPFFFFFFTLAYKQLDTRCGQNNPLCPVVPSIWLKQLAHAIVGCLSDKQAFLLAFCESELYCTLIRCNESYCFSPEQICTTSWLHFACLSVIIVINLWGLDHLFIVLCVFYRVTPWLCIWWSSSHLRRCYKDSVRRASETQTTPEHWVRQQPLFIMK